jgi:signal transduction histidine kinase
MPDPTAPDRKAGHWVWIQLLIGWVPAWVLFTMLMVTVHGIGFVQAAPYALRLVAAAALLGLVVVRVAARWPWPHPMRWRFMALHVLAAPLYALAWVAVNSLIESAWQRRWVVVVGVGLPSFLVTGIWFYAMIAGVAYAQQAARRAAEAQALSARTRLAALRSQLHPHFLFNALHTVVQLIPIAPREAQRAAEELAALLRGTLDNEHDLLPLADEWALVQRYLAIEQMRLGDRLRVEPRIEAAALHALVPAFALQTLVENAVRHAAENRLEPTTLRLAARLDGDALRVTVDDDGPGAAPAQLERTGGGLARLRERAAGLLGPEARLELSSLPGAGFSARLRVPQREADG